MRVTRSLYVWALGFLLLSCIGGSTDETRLSHLEMDPFIHDTCIVVVNRYKNGSIADSGMFCNGKKEGFWQAFYADGTLKWKGRYRAGWTTMPALDSLPKNCEFVFEKNADFSLNKGFQFRVLAPPLGPKAMIIHINAGRYADPLDPDNFDYMIVPTIPGELCIELGYAHRSGYPICKKCIQISADS